MHLGRDVVDYKRVWNLTGVESPTSRLSGMAYTIFYTHQVLKWWNRKNFGTNTRKAL